jgi:transposase
MNATTIAIDLAKSVFQLAVSSGVDQPMQFVRLSRAQFARWFRNRPVDLVLMEACSSAHHWARWFQSQGIAVRLLPPHQIRPYVKRNKTDAADALALLEANRCADLHPVPVKSIEQQCLQSLHRVRAQWVRARTARINNLRGCCREFGLVVAEGSRRGLAQIATLLADDQSAVPSLLRTTLCAELDEVRLLDQRIADLERQLSGAASVSSVCENLQSVPGVGLITSTAMAAKTGGHVSQFLSNRTFASWFGLVPKEHSSGNRRHLGRISKRGDRYLRMLLTHGARSVLRAATVAQRQGKPLDRLRTWALAIQARTHRNKAVCALANKLARICYAVLRDGVPYRGLARLSRHRGPIDSGAH